MIIEIPVSDTVYSYIQDPYQILYDTSWYRYMPGKLSIGT